MSCPIGADDPIPVVELPQVTDERWAELTAAQARGENPFAGLADPDPLMVVRALAVQDMLAEAQSVADSVADGLLSLREGWESLFGARSQDTGS